MRVNERSKYWSDLSSYLDGEMTGREKTALEQRLQGDEHLRSELNQMKVTRAMLRSLPRRKVPHDFVLSPEMVKATQKNVWLPVFGYTSVASALIAIVLLLVQFLPGSMLSTGTLQAAKPAAEMAAETVLVQDQSGNPEIIYWGGLQQNAPMVGAEGKGGGAADGATGTAPYVPPAVAFAEPAQQAIPLEESAPSALPETAATSPAEGELTREAISPTQETLSAAPETLSSAGQQTGAILGIRPAEEENKITFPSDISIETSPAPARSEIPLSLAFIFLGVAVLTSVATFVFWQRH